MGGEPRPVADASRRTNQEPAHASEPDRHRTPLADSMLIDCDDCSQQATAACQDCVVTFLCERDSASAVVVDVAEARALRLLGDAGLAPKLRHVRRTG